MFYSVLLPGITASCLRGFLFVAISCCVISACGERELTAVDWQKDLRVLEGQLIKRHVDPFHSISELSFGLAVDDLYDRIPTMSEAEILVGYSKIAALIGDGHTSFFPGDQTGRWFRYYPFMLYSFSDGIYVIVAPEDNADMLGRRLIRIDDTSIEDAFSIISATIGADNEMEYVYTVPDFLNRPELLHALGIAKSADRAEFVFDGEEVYMLEAVRGRDWENVEWLSASSLFQELTNFGLNYLFATPLTLKNVERGDYYWFTYLEDRKTIYFQYNRCWDEEDKPTFEAVAQELFEFLDSHAVERVVVDIRNNSGGEPAIAQPLIDGFAERAEFTEAGRLFVLVGRRTFSAALTNAIHLRRQANARIVGEPPRGKPNNPSEGRDIVLRRTNTVATVSTQFVERDPELGDLDFLPVEIVAAHSITSYQENVDPVLDAALNAQVEGIEQSR